MDYGDAACNSHRKEKGKGHAGLRMKCARRDARAIQTVYVVAAVVWVALVFFVVLRKHGRQRLAQLPRTRAILAGLILLTPIFVYGLSFANAAKIRRCDEKNTTRSDSLSFISIAAFVLISWVGFDEPAMHRIVITASILLVFSLIEVWFGPKGNSVMFHIREALQTAGLILFAYALFVYLLGTKGPDRDVAPASHPHDNSTKK